MENNGQEAIDIYAFEPQAVVVDAGQFPTDAVPLRLLDGCSKVVCCDSAADKLLDSGREPYRIVGDLDSLSPAVRRKYAKRLVHIDDQETNDQTKAVTYVANELGLKSIAIVGATGLREDHTLGNISLLIDYMRLGLTARIFTDYGVFVPCQGTASFKCPPGTQVSVFNFGATGLRADGLKWQLRDFGSWWQGTLNETTSDRFTVTAAEGCYLIFVNYPTPSKQIRAL